MLNCRMLADAVFSLADKWQACCHFTRAEAYAARFLIIIYLLSLITLAARASRPPTYRETAKGPSYLLYRNGAEH